MPIGADAVDPAFRTDRRQADGAGGEVAPPFFTGGGVDGVQLVVGGAAEEEQAAGDHGMEGAVKLLPAGARPGGVRYMRPVGPLQKELPGELLRGIAASGTVSAVGVPPLGGEQGRAE